MKSLLTKARLLQSLLIAVLVALILFVVAIGPAECGIDPLGFGKLMGIKPHTHEHSHDHEHAQPTATKHPHRLLKMEQAGSKSDVAIPKEVNNAAPKKQFEERYDEIIVEVPPKRGIEYKVDMLKYGKLKYDWKTEGADVFFDFHGEVKEENPPKNCFYETYTLAYSDNMVGTLTAPFEGKHGWYFKNLGNRTEKITLRLKGEYRLRK